ncbi:P36-like protein homologue [Plasmodium ovale wallikeri]|uniref:p36-like protein homologue n=2 Tax=Plasmodium ovale TaxID=36330 RepID=A0A1A8YII1_PLAOA|nr:P36-like protein homologue [Plasmodium ovale wallikeri]SBT31946.1 P36-like protein homologue [Plasmodium ovale wallikeri]SBT75548.1 conserved Plasmodium protein, unknown function [Plasmodium ovale]
MPKAAKTSAEKLTAIRNYVQNFDHNHECDSINGFAKLLKDMNIKMAVFDFDLTIIGAHSGGYIDKSDDVENIGQSVTDHFKMLSSALHANGIKITVATFSDEEAIRYSRVRNPNLISGEQLVQYSLKKSKCDAKIEKVYAYYPYYYKEPRKYRQLGLDKPMSNDKSFHLERIRQDFNVGIDEIIFVDDDMNNCISAKNEGYITFNVTGKDGFNFRNVKVL